MTKNPYINALAAGLYIATLIFGIYLASTAGEIEETILIPMAMLSLLVFSVATMAYLFFYQPVMLFLEGRKQEAVSFFLKTLMTFGALTLGFIVLMALVPALA